MSKTVKLFEVAQHSFNVYELGFTSDGATSFWMPGMNEPANIGPNQRVKIKIHSLSEKDFPIVISAEVETP